ncbi:MAG: pteridine reductase [Pseudomonadota bacterium]
MTQHPETRVAIVTGGARRIGATIVRALHARGLNVLIHCRSSRTQADALAARLNGERSGSAAVIQAELGDDAAPAAIIGAALSAFGRVDVLVNNASSFYPTPAADASHPDWHALVDSNQRAPFWLSLEFARAAAGTDGSVVNLVDIHGIVPLADHAIYSQAKAGLIMQTRALAKDLAPEIRVNGVAPGTILWPEGEGANSNEAMRDILERVPLGRQGRPEDIAGAVVFLALDAPYITGQILAVDGGRLLNM